MISDWRHSFVTMKTIFVNLKKQRFSLLILLSLILISVSFVTRLALMIKSGVSQDVDLFSLVEVFAIGFFFDMVNASYFMIPLMIYLWMVPRKVYQKSWHRGILSSLIFLFTFILVFDAVSEWFFWDEFSTRFNFIAVDYLIYTTEVVGNIRQSYPIEWYLLGAVVISAAVVYVAQSWIRASATQPLAFSRRSITLVSLSVIPTLAFFFVDTRLHHFSNNNYMNELAGNGMYELFAAYRNNELDYDQFYARGDERKVFQRLRTLLQTPEATFVDDSPFSLERFIRHDGPEKKLNVVLISVESFSADFMGLFGNTKNITPFLDSLAQHSRVYTNVYATGTRTVRGLEALSLCVPPTPGQSIVRRPHNEHLFTLGTVFDQKGYESKYIYGGYGYFDNMNYFFANNGYMVADRMLLSESEIDYENIWGVADENLFELATREIEKTISSGKPAFAHIMTTSNHRPFTYPDGRIDIPSHTSRKGAVKYTDYAIGKFIHDIQSKPWFNNTIVVIVADHCASSAGKTELPVDKYHIPLLVYSPGHIAPGRENRLMSQIDVGPTLLGMLNFSYKSKFLGYDIHQLEPGRERAFISTYQTLGYVRDSVVIALHPQRQTEGFLLSHGQQVSVARPDTTILNEAISWYQGASFSFKNGLMKQ
jgi:phosphoglycerol transferase MdoB-like AlkP superfamily enzyme